MTMNLTFADFRRRLVPGAVLETNYLNGGLVKGNPPARRILSGTDVLVMEACAWSNGRESRFQLPKASEVEITGPNSFIVRDSDDYDGAMWREYTIVADAS